MKKYAVLGFFRAFRIWIFLHFLNKLPTYASNFKRDSNILKHLQKLDLSKIVLLFIYFLVIFFFAEVILIWAEFVYLLFNLMFTYAGVIQLFESYGDPWSNEEPPTSKQTFFFYVYYSLVTLSTVGYGEISPLSTLGRISCIFFILISIVLVPFQITKLSEYLNSLPKTLGNKNTNFYFRKNILITGTVTPLSLEIMLENLFFESIVSSSVPPKVTVLNTSPISNEVRNLLNFPIYSSNIFYYVGSPMSKITLIDLQVHKFDSVLILANKETENKIEEDTKNIMKYWSIKNHSIYLNIYIEILTETMKKTIMSLPNPEYISRDNVVCIEELRSFFFAQNCIFPGKRLIII